MNQRVKFWLKLSLAAVILYSGTFLYFFWQTPLGMTPVLDGAENIILADQIFKNTLKEEPFYRAMLYPAYLAAFRFIGFTVEDLNGVAAVSGILFHILNSLLCGYLAMLLWNSNRALIAGILLYGFYPVALHFAADPLDITMAIFFLLASSILLVKFLAKHDYKIGIASCLLMGLGILFRPNLLPAVAIYLILMIKSSAKKALLAGVISLVTILSAGGLINYLHSGDFRILPWQGGFNLYAANYDGANGKFFQQTLMLTDRELGKNPARLESEILYLKDSENERPIKVDEFNKYWRNRFWQAITDKPTEWFKLMLKKIYYLFNNFEQYNNKTYSFHKNLSIVLRYNPLCFGIILLLAAISVFNKPSSNKKSAILYLLFFLSIGVLAFYVSGRFRFLIVPLLISFAAGAFTVPLKLIANKNNLILVLVTAFITFSGFAGANDTSTYNSDRLLLAHACARLEKDREQIKWANEVLKNHPENIIAIRVKLVGFTNLALAGKLKKRNEWDQIKSEMEFLNNKKINFFDTLFISGCYAYRIENNRQKAIKLWQAGLEQSSQKDLFTAALLLTKAIKPQETMLKAAQNSPLLWYALVQTGLIKPEKTNEMKTSIQAIKFLLGIDNRG
ncbi:MAG: hypothetical protein ACQETH_10495 [Candidatus Rifleibacteriota bacterium]